MTAPATKKPTALGRKLHGVPVWALALAGLAVAYLAWRHFKGGASAGTDLPLVAATSDTSAAQTPSGGGGSAGENLPPILTTTGPDSTTAQVQQADAGGTPGGSTVQGQPYGGQPQTLNGTPVTSNPIIIGGQTYEQSAPGSDYLAPTPPQTGTGGNAHTPGLQI